MLDWPATRPIVLVDERRQPDQLTSALIETWALELLEHLPQAQLHFYEESPSPEYRHLKRLLAYAGAYSQVRRGEHLTQIKAVAQKLLSLTELAHQRYSRMAAASVDDWAAYLAHNHTRQVAANRPEPWHFVLITDLQDLAASQPDAFQALKRLCQQGPAAGIVPILLKRPLEHLGDQIPLHHKHIQAFWQHGLPLVWGLDVTQFKEEALSGIKPLNQHNELWRLLTRFNPVVECAVLAERSKGLADDMIESAQAETKQSSGDDFLSVAIGHAAQSGAPVAFRMGDACNCHHAFVGGETRSGKSTAIMNIILGACEQAPPQALQLSLLDFKRNVSFGAFRGLPHVRTLIDHDAPDSVLQALAEFEDEIDRRGALFDAVPDFYNGTLAKYNTRAVSDGFIPLPRWLMILDEAHAPLQDNPRIRNAANRMLSRIARRAGAAFHLQHPNTS
jgi:DNA segregation ATPase FtsK/SpoIIIE-like protein